MLRNTETVANCPFTTATPGLDEEVVLRLLEPVVEVAGAVAGGDGYLRIPQADAVEVLADVGGAAHPDVVAELGAGREPAGVELLDAQDRRRPLQTVKEVSTRRWRRRRRRPSL